VKGGIHPAGEARSVTRLTGKYPFYSERDGVLAVRTTCTLRIFMITGVKPGFMGIKVVTDRHLPLT